jgi:putative endonuclease
MEDKKDNTEKGKEGEELAATFLKEKGYTILHKNYRFKQAEVDLIASRGRVLAFVEVKLRTSVSYGYPETFIDKHKQQMLKTAAAYYLNTLSNHNYILRFDSVAVTLLQNKKPDIQHFEDVIA